MSHHEMYHVYSFLPIAYYENSNSSWTHSSGSMEFSLRLRGSDERWAPDELGRFQGPADGATNAWSIYL